MENAVHVFELAGLGKAPFRFLGVEKRQFQACPGAPIQAGGSCDYCAAPITYFCWIRSADGQQFKVGCDCVLKTGDAGLSKRVTRAMAPYEAAKRAAAKVRKAARVVESSAPLFVRLEALAALARKGSFAAQIADSFAAQLRKGKALSPRQSALLARLEGEQMAVAS